MNEFKDLIKNSSKAPESPVNEWSLILSKIESTESISINLLEVLKNKFFWMTSCGGAVVALAIVISLNNSFSIDEGFNEVSALYSEELTTEYQVIE